MRRGSGSRLLPWTLVLAASLTLAACGGGSGSDTGPADVPVDAADVPGTDIPADLPAPDARDVPPADLPGDVPPADAPPADLPPADLPADVPPADVPPADVPPEDLPGILPDAPVPPCVGDPGVAAWPADVSATFLRGPFVQDVVGDHAVVVFRPAVPLAEQGCVDWSFFGTGMVGQRTCADPDGYGQYAVRLDGLPAVMLIDYTASVGTALSAGPFSFLTAPPPDRPQRILVMSDIHASKDNTATVLSKIVTKALADGVDFAMTAGDNVSASEETQFDDFFDGLRPLLHRVPIFTTIGNHEGRNANYFEAFVLPEADPPDPTAAEMYYAFRRGNVWVGVLEIFDWQLSWYLAEPFGQVDWLAKELDSVEARSARWRLLFIHEPPWGRNWTPCGDPGYFGEQALRDLLIPMARDKGVSAIFSGHFHEYEHGEVDGVHLFVVGGAGGGLESVVCTPPADFPEPWTVDQVHHGVTVDTGCDAMTVVATDIDGNEIDRVTVPYAGA